MSAVQFLTPSLPRAPPRPLPWRPQPQATVCTSQLWLGPPTPIPSSNPPLTLSLPCSAAFLGHPLTTRCQFPCPQGYWFQKRGLEPKSLCFSLITGPTLCEHPHPPPVTPNRKMAHHPPRAQTASQAAGGFQVFLVYPLVTEERRKNEAPTGRETLPRTWNSLGSSFQTSSTVRWHGRGQEEAR